MSKFDFISYKKYTKAGFRTALVAGVCCFTPLFVWGFAFAGLAAFTFWIDFVLLLHCLSGWPYLLSATDATR